MWKGWWCRRRGEGGGGCSRPDSGVGRMSMTEAESQQNRRKQGRKMPAYA